MGNHRFFQVDAFTTNPLGGNPCAIIFESDGLSEKQMIAIAQEMNLSETVFVLTPTKTDFKARYFTPIEEIPLAGHPTISLIHILHELGLIQKPSMSLELPAGEIRVDIELDAQSKNPHITMFQNKPKFMTEYPADTVLPVFGLSAQDKLPNAPIQTVSTGTPQLMIPLKSLDALKSAEMDFERYRKLKAQGDFFSPHLFCLSGATSDGDTFARHFGIPPDTFEDPFTGSATGNMGCFLWHYNLIKNPKFIAEQGHWMGRPGRAQVEVVGEPGNIETVKLSGTAVTVLSGTLTI